MSISHALQGLQDHLDRPEHPAATYGASNPPPATAPLPAAAPPAPELEIRRLQALLRLRDEHFDDVNERYLRNRAAAIALGSIYLRMRNELKRLKADPNHPRKLTDPARLSLVEKMRSLIEEQELSKLSRGTLHPRDPSPRW